MHKSFDLFFVSSNIHKYQEAKTLLQETKDVTIVKKIKKPNLNHRGQSFP